MYSLQHLLLLLLAANPGYGLPTTQQPLQSHLQKLDSLRPLEALSKPRGLTGKFLHISDLHVDPFYKYHSSTDKESACHRERGPAGLLGAESSDCDSPITLINETFRWIQENLRDDIDFVIWTGDSARHDNDEQIPRTEEQVLKLNNLVVDKFVEVFGKDDNINDTDPTNDFVIPIVPTYGNNDILPHNIFTPGPNRWTKNYLHIWRNFIPEEQRHGFGRGGWFSVEVIPNRLTVFSLNTLYFFDSNAAVDGCAQSSEPGYEQLEWFRIQLQFIRERGMKAIIMGHVPPARTSSKRSWDETCFQKYTLWMQQYRDIVVGSLYGHMNIDHFMLQDFNDVHIFSHAAESDNLRQSHSDDEFSIESASDYLEELRARWSKLPDPPNRKEAKVVRVSDECSARTRVSHLFATKTEKGKKGNKDNAYQKFLDKIGGPWGERFCLSLVSPSVVPNYYPTLRVIQYNITALDLSTPESSTRPTATNVKDDNTIVDALDSDQFRDNRKKRKPKYPKFQVPTGPSKSSPPGPAYSPQTFTWLGYTQYYANLTALNRDFTADDEEFPASGTVESSRWKDGKHSGKKPKDKDMKVPLKSFKFEVEYNTRTDKVYKLKDLTVRSYFDLANRIGQYKPKKSDRFILDSDPQDFDDFEQKDIAESARTSEANDSPHGGVPDANEVSPDNTNKDKKKKHKKHGKRKATNRVWLSFVRRAFVGSRDDDDLHDEFGQPVK